MRKQQPEAGSTSKLGPELDKLLQNRGLSQSKLADATKVSQPYVSGVLRGRKTAQPSWLDTVATALELTEEERAALHRAGARDRGFKIDL